MLRPFEILAPKTLGEACASLAQYGSDAAIYAGGTELLLLMKEGLVHYPFLVDIKVLPELSQITLAEQRFRIGAAATHRDIERSQLVRSHAPILSEVESMVANVRVRSAGTIGGNLCFGEPHSDPATLLLAWGADLTLASAQGQRSVSIDDFFLGLFETARQPEEIMIAVDLPVLPSGRGAGYQKFSLHERPTATAAAVVGISNGVIHDARLAAGSVGPRPVRIPQAEALLEGEAPSAEIFQEAGQVVARQVEPVDDLYGTSAYKRHLIAVLCARALAQAADRANGQSGADT